MTEVTGTRMPKARTIRSTSKLCASFALYQVDCVRPTSELPRCALVLGLEREIAHRRGRFCSVSQRRVRSMRGHGRVGDQDGHAAPDTTPGRSLYSRDHNKASDQDPGQCRYGKPQPAKRRLPNP